MNKNELQTVLGYLNLGLAVAHSAGVTIGHFGSTDFLALAQQVNALLLQAVSPAAAPAASVAPAPATASVAVAVN